MMSKMASFHNEKSNFIIETIFFMKPGSLGVKTVLHINHLIAKIKKREKAHEALVLFRATMARDMFPTFFIIILLHILGFFIQLS